MVVPVVPVTCHPVMSCSMMYSTGCRSIRADVEHRRDGDPLTPTGDRAELDQRSVVDHHAVRIEHCPTCVHHRDGGQVGQVPGKQGAA
jgi:hypothetical protein